MTHLRKVSVIGILILLGVISLWLSIGPRNREGNGRNVRAFRAASEYPGALLVEIAALKARHSVDRSRAACREILAILKRMPGSQASDWLLAQLRSHENFQTGLGFVIGEANALTEWPSWRAFLLDALLALDPETAAMVARSVLEQGSSPDEWTLALRNLAVCAETASDLGFIKAKTAELILNPQWRTAAPASYLEAFDLIVFTRDTTLAPSLLEFCSDQDHKAVRHAAFLALDHLMVANPGALLGTLIPASAGQPQNGLMIANMVARADVRDPGQRELTENWLMDEARNGGEIQAFAAVFPNASRRIGRNLLTAPQGIDAAELAAGDRAALTVVEAWLGDTRFSRLHDSLRLTHDRLQSFVTSR